MATFNTTLMRQTLVNWNRTLLKQMGATLQSSACVDTWGASAHLANAVCIRTEMSDFHLVWHLFCLELGNEALVHESLCI
jgi:hypothetical protein